MTPLADLSASMKRLLPASLKRSVRALIGKPSPPTRMMRRWVIKPGSFPWFDNADALTVLDKRAPRDNLSDTDYQRLHEWVTDGYFVVPGMVNHQLIDSMMHDLDELWTTDTPQ